MTFKERSCVQAQEAATAKDWTLGMAAYDRVLATLKSVARTSDAQQTADMPPKKKRKKSKVIYSHPSRHPSAMLYTRDTRWVSIAHSS